MNRFLREPISVRNAASVIVTATFIVVVGGGIAIRAIDHREYSSIWEGMWWSLQTVTTVGYGDVTPKDTAGKIVGAVVMLEGIAFLAIVTAAITSTFVTRAQREQKSGGAARGHRSRKQQATRSSTRSPRGLSGSSRCWWSSRDGDSHCRRLDPERTWRGDRARARIGTDAYYAEKDDSKMRGFRDTGLVDRVAKTVRAAPEAQRAALCS